MKTMMMVILMSMLLVSCGKVKMEGPANTGTYCFVNMTKYNIVVEVPYMGYATRIKPFDTLVMQCTNPANGLCALGHDFNVRTNFHDIMQGVVHEINYINFVIE